MKKLFTISVVVLLVSFAFAQVPQGMSYQAIAFNSGGAPVVNGNVGIKISILDNSTSGPVVYAETYTKTTNAQGLFNLNIGQGNATTGTFSAINWATNSKFLKVELDPTGGTNYTSVGTNQLMTVPYAFYSEKSAQASTIAGIGSLAGNNGNFLIYDGSDAKAFSVTTGTWSSTSMTGYIDTAATSGNNFLITDGSDAKAWNGQTGQWYSTSMTGYIDSVSSANGNFLIVDGSDAKSWSGQTNTWTPTTMTGYIDASFSTRDNFLIINGSDASAFNSQTGIWYSTSMTGYIDGVVPSNGNFLIYDGSDAKVWNSSNSTWVAASMTGYIDKAIGTK